MMFSRFASRSCSLLYISRNTKRFAVIRCAYSYPIKANRLSVCEQARLFASGQSGPIPNSQRSGTGGSGDGKSGKSTFWQNAFRKENLWKWSMVTIAGMFVSGVYVAYDWFSDPAIDEHGNVIPDVFTDLPPFEAKVRRTWHGMLGFVQSIQEPAFEKLLPDPLKPPYIQPKYTLVIELEDILLHGEHSMKTGWRFLKRPGLEFFFQQLSYPMFEIVIFTEWNAMSAFTLVQGLDPEQRFIAHRLFRDSTRYESGIHVKDLSYLNRDLSRVIVLDWNKNRLYRHPDNLFKMPRWNGDEADTSLVQLTMFLKSLAQSGVDDVRPTLHFYNQHDDPLEVFKEKVAVLEKEERQMQEAKAKSSKGRFSFLR